ncbi:uncharacterized protein LOC131233785 [Magnolia sinica]|uniref:uncharacterized protein LOC131233785 n=1 Tax=Magnolia sinica TaxID=86752 RepID=UPI00265ABD5A|nr:uncharacterized protein LOC131233785 [Magnolia sinica]
MAFMAVLESDLRALSAEARRKFPAVKDGAEHAILKLRSLSSPGEIALNEDILRIFLMACEVKSVKLSVIGLACLQKLISHDAVAPPALKEILSTLKDHAEISDESVQLKTLQTILIIFQSHLLPENEDNVAQALGICLRLLENNRSSDSVRNTAAATFRQAVALIFDHVVCAESLPAGKVVSGNHVSRTSSITDEVSRRINRSMSLEGDFVSERLSALREGLTKAGKLGLRLLEDLTALAAGGSAILLRVTYLHRTFALDILEFILSHYVAVFRTLVSYEQVLRHQICSLLMTSLRTNVELEGEAGEPSFRRLVLRSVAHVIRLYSLSLVTECEVFLSMLVKVTSLDLPLWHRILVLEVLRGFCVEVRTMRLLFQNFDMNPKNTNVVENMVKALARVVSSIQVPDTSEESLAAVAGMFSSKAKGIEWSLDNDASNAAVVVASEAHAITLAVEGLLGVVFTVATLTDEAVDVGEIESPRCDSDPPGKFTGQTADLCIAMVDSMWLTILDALSLILTRSQGEAIILEILKGYQAFTQACGVLRTVEPLNSFLASLCKFTISYPNEAEKRSVLLSPGSKRSEALADQRDNIVLTLKNVQALRTLFNIAHRLHNVLGPSWVLVLETLAALDQAIHSPHATTQEVSTTVPRFTKETSGQYSDFNILSSLNSQLFESSALMHLSAVKSLLSALHQLSNQCISGNFSGSGQTLGQQIGSITFAVERMISILLNNLHRVEPLWDQVVGHLLELSENSNPQLRNMALDALDQSICAVLGSDRFQSTRNHFADDNMEIMRTDLRSFECSIISPLRVLYKSTQNPDVHAGSLKILLHVLERHGEKLYYSWLNILEMLRSVADASEKDLIPLGFQSVRVIMNDGLSTIPSDCLDVCVEVTGAYSSQKTELNISLTAIGLLWTATDFIARGLVHVHNEEKEPGAPSDIQASPRQKDRGEKFQDQQTAHTNNEVHDQVSMINTIDRDRLLLLVFSILQKLGADERPEVRNSAIRTLFQTLGSHGQKLSSSMWQDCLWNYVFPILDRVNHLAATSSKDEWQGKELGTRGGKAVHMLIHHSRNTAHKQWDETLVLVLGGISRLLRSFFPFLQSLNNFWAGWESLLIFVRNSISNGSKEVALAAINCLQTTVVSHCPKGNLPMPYLKSVLDVYDVVLKRSPNYRSNAVSKVKQELLHSLGNLYVQAQTMFNNDMYLQLLEIVNLAVRQPKSTSDNVDTEFGNVPLVQRTMLEILPLLRPTEHISSMWSHLLRELLHYLPGSETILDEQEDMEQSSGINHKPKGVEMASHRDINSFSETDRVEISKNMARETQETMKFSFPNGAMVPYSLSVMTNDKMDFSSHLFGEKLVPILVNLFLQSPASEKCNVFPEIIQGLGRCMSTRRDNPDGALWRLAVEGFNCVLVDDVSRLNMDQGIDPPARTRMWKEVADVYEIFLMGSCGRALPSDALSPAALKADELLEMTVLNVLGDNILKKQIDAPIDILQRLVSTLDRCASRTSCLPVETVGLMPSHCSRFSLTCLQKIFSLCSYTFGGDWNSTRSEVSKVSIVVLMNRCEYILKQFLIDENDLGERLLPTVRLEEMIYVLQELARLVIHTDTASVLPLQPYLKESLVRNENHDGRAHLLVLLPAFCELVISREARVRELVQVLLRLITAELGLQKVRMAG